MSFGESLSKIYVTIVDGKFAVRSSESDPKAVKRELKSGQVVYELRFGSFTGKLKEVYFRMQDFNGKQWEEMHLLVFDGQDHVQIQIPFPSNYSNSFLRAIKNANLDAEMTFSPWRKVVNDKVKSALYINQNGESVPWYFTQEKPNGLPDLVPYKIPGKEEVKYSDVDRNLFFKHMVDTEITPALRKVWDKQTPAASTKQPIGISPDDITEPIDDLPF